MNWYKSLAYALDKEFNDQFMKIGSIPDLEYCAGRRIRFVINESYFEGTKYLRLNLIVSDGTHKNVLNRFRKVVKEFGYFNGIIYEGVMSKKAYDKVCEFRQIKEACQFTIDEINEESKEYFEFAYGDFLEEF